MSDSSDLSDHEETQDHVDLGRKRASLYEHLKFEIKFKDQIEALQKMPKKWFLNESVLEKIFEKLRLDDLRQCRLVHPAWSRAGSKVMFSKWNKYMLMDLRDTFAVKEFSQILEKGDEYLPFGIHLRWSSCSSSYDRCYYGYEKRSKPEAIPFLWKKLVLIERHFNQFERVRLDVAFDQLSFFDYFFEGPFQNIQHLELVQVKKNELMIQRDLDEQEIVEELSSKDWNLTKLRSITFNNSSTRCNEINNEFLVKLLKSSPNLENIYGLPSSSLTAAIDAMKLDAILEIGFCGCFGPRQKDNNFFRIPQLSVPRLTVCRGYHDDEVSDLIELPDLFKILQAVEKSLKFLRIEQAVVDTKISSAKLPVFRIWPTLEFHHLTTLHLLEPVPFPANVCSMFPVLEKIRLERKHGRDEKNKIADFLWKEPLSSVKCLEFCRFVSPDEDIQTLATLFPNVETICVDYPKYKGKEDPFHHYRHSVATNIWSVEAFKQLKDLEIVHLPLKLDDRPVRSSEDDYFTLDGFFTGFPEFLVKRLRLRPELFDPKSVATEMARKDRSLVTLKGLKKITVSFVCNERGDRAFFTQYPTISTVTTRYALNLMPDLDVLFSYDRIYDDDCEHALRPIAQVVPLGHRDYNEPF